MADDEVTDEFMARVGEAIGAARSGDPEGARMRCAALWAELGPVAHYTADVEPELGDELAWDLRALDAAAQVTDQPALSRHLRRDQGGHRTCRGSSAS